MAIIKRIVTGQTFGNWLDTTNKMIDDLNAANPLRNVDKLVRYDGSGSIGVNTLRLKDFHLDSNTDISINAISSDFTDAIHENDYTLFTAKATYEAIKAEDKNIIKNATGHHSSTEFVQVNSANVEVVIGGSQQMIITSSETTFEKDLTVKGDLQVLGDSTEFQTQVLSVEDNNITLNRMGNDTTAEGAGFDVDGTTASFSLVDSGNRFPYDQTGSSNKVPLQLYNVNEKRNFYVNNATKSLDDRHFKGSQLTGVVQDLRYVKVNQKDSVIFTYGFNGDDLANNVPLAIGSKNDSGREAFVLQPDPDDPSSTANSEVTYSISNGTLAGTRYFSDYLSYKTAFQSEVKNSSNTVQIVFSPDNPSSATQKYYYWAGEVAPQTFDCLTQYNVADNEIVHQITDQDGNPTFNAFNRNFKIALGDRIRFEIDLDALNAIDGVRSPFFIGVEPFNFNADSVNSDDRFKLQNLVFDEPGARYQGGIQYEIDGTYFFGTGGLANYISAFQSGSTANVTFIPDSLNHASEFEFYYFNSANNHSVHSYNFGGLIEVSANNTGMGEEISVISPMGLQYSKEIIYNGPDIEFGGVNNSDFILDAGDTLILDITPTIGQAALDLKISGVNAEETDGVIYEIDNTKYGKYSDFATAWSATTAGSYANVHVTPFSSGTIDYSTTETGVSGSGTITVNTEKASSLSAFLLATNDPDQSGAIENPHSFKITKNHNPVLILDGETANFSGTSRGVQLPSDTLSNPAANGVIRYNDGIGLFEGFTGGTWRGLGGVIDLNQDTSIAAHDSDDILQFNANGARISEMKEDQFFLRSFSKTVLANTGNLSIESNVNPGKYKIVSTGDVEYDGGTTGTQTSSMTIQPNGIHIDSTGFMKIPIGTKTERPSSPSKGMIRFAEDSVQLDSSDTLNGIAQPILKESLEYYNGTDWITLSTIKNEFSITVPADSQYVTFKNIHRPFEKYEIDIFINGLRIPKIDIVDIVPTQTSASPDYYDCRIEFSSQRKAGQIITVIQVPQRYLGETTAGFLSKGELVNGLSDPIALLGQVDIGVGTDTTSIGSGALVVTGGIGISGGITIGKSLIELSAGELKENVKPIESALEKVQKLNGVEFTWKDEQKRDSLPEYGLIAENVANIVPSLASFDQEKPTGVKYSKVVALLIEAVKQQQSEINELRSQIPKKRTRKTTTSKNS